MIAIACDHSAVELKEKIKTLVADLGLSVKDYGCFSADSVDYPDYAFFAAHAVASGECDKGILVCGTGIGMSIAANKVHGIRCALCHSEFEAKMCREHNNANMIAVGARTIGDGALPLIKTFLTTPFSSEARHQLRVQKIMKLEDGKN